MIITENILDEKVPKEMIPTRLDSAMNLYTNVNCNGKSGIIVYNTNPDTWNCLYSFYELNHKFTIDEYNFDKENIFIQVDEGISDSKIIRGSAVHPGKIRGHVKLVFCDDDIKKINDGDIIVSPMTVPTFINGMKKANAIITDEGGVVCHAALIAREMKKICVIGTKIATKVLSDNMYVEVDGDLGIVRILDK